MSHAADGHNQITQLDLERRTILQIGDGNSSEPIDTRVLVRLIAAGLIYVRPEDRRLVLTESGQRTYDQLTRP
jgi:hypothetical protein